MFGVPKYTVNNTPSYTPQVVRRVWFAWKHMVGGLWVQDGNVWSKLGHVNPSISRSYMYMEIFFLFFFSFHLLFYLFLFHILTIWLVWFNLICLLNACTTYGHRTVHVTDVHGVPLWRPRFLINPNHRSSLLTVVKSRSTWVLTSKTSPTNPNDTIDQVDTHVWSTLGQSLGQTPPKP
jgi:hypothetical protein